MTSKAKSKIVAGLENAAEYARVQRAVFDWIRDDAPVAIKMMMMPEHCSKLVDRIVGSRTTHAQRSRAAASPQINEDTP
jgi:hypothetical protein